MALRGLTPTRYVGRTSLMPGYGPGAVPGPAGYSFSSPTGFGSPAATAAMSAGAGGANTGALGGMGAFNTGDPMQNAMLNMIGQYQKNYMLNPAQQQTLANQMVNSQIAQSLIPMQASTAAMQAYYNQQALRAKGFSEAINAVGPQDAAAVASIYNDAAGRVAGLGTGLTGAVAAAQQQATDQAQQTVAQQTGGLGQVQGYSNPALENVSRYTGVVLPSTNLYSEAANRGAQAAWQQAANAGEVKNIGLNYLSQAAMAQKQLALQKTALEMQRPYMMQQAYMNLRNMSRSDLATAMQGIGIAGMYGYRQGKLAQGQEGINIRGQSAAGTATNASGVTVPRPGNYFVSPGVAAKITPHWMLDPTDPTYSRIIPDPNNPPPGQIYKNGQFVPKPGSTKGTSQAQVTSIQNQISKNLLGAPYATNTTSPFLKGIKPDNWMAHMPKTEMRQRLLSLFPPDARNRPNVKAYVETQLGRLDWSLMNSLGGGNVFARPR